MLLLNCQTQDYNPESMANEKSRLPCFNCNDVPESPCPRFQQSMSGINNEKSTCACEQSEPDNPSGIEPVMPAAHTSDPNINGDIVDIITMTFTPAGPTN